MTLAVDDAVADLRPSARLVFLVLDNADEPLTQAEIASATGLTTRTVRNALRELEGRVSVEFCRTPSDPRKGGWQFPDTPEE